MAEVARERKLPVDDKIHTWPHLVRMEFLLALFALVGLTLWSIMIDAPLEEAANPTRTPNPSKVSKSDSHGCVRLTNWDVDRLAKLLKKGTEVAFIEREGASKK